ncbi:MAG: ABC transporter ATP-binding protein [Anaerolineae bacterium]|jgi:putative ABC transport system ATP-binding protein|nr:ABC transporter ATP-binding protein [Anaerolineae bacterium]
MAKMVIDVKDMTKIYQMGDVQVKALAGVSFQVEEGELLAIMGPSGSGKSTMMNMLGCLDIPTSGDYYLAGEQVSKLSDNQLADIRNRKVGFVFQKFMLLANLTAFGNVELPLRYAGVSAKRRRERSEAALEAVGLGDRMKHRSNELSGGQQQRVAVARAIVTNPAILMADEPTGNLDSKSGKEIMDLLLKMNREQDATVIIVTHDAMIAEQCDRIIYLMDGLIEKDERK